VVPAALLRFAKANAGVKGKMKETSSRIMIISEFGFVFVASFVVDLITLTSPTSISGDLDYSVTRRATQYLTCSQSSTTLHTYCFEGLSEFEIGCTACV
jgi:hypothetical protein